VAEQQQRPPVWLIWDSDLDCWVDNVFRDRQGAEFVADGDDVVEMVMREPGRVELVAALRRIHAMENGQDLLDIGRQLAYEALRKAGET
jgi:hypothetical protein